MATESHSSANMAKLSSGEMVAKSMWMIGAVARRLGPNRTPMRLGPPLPPAPMPVPSVKGSYDPEHQRRHANLPKDGLATERPLRSRSTMGLRAVSVRMPPGACLLPLSK